MDKKSIVLLIVSATILIIAIIFAVWSFQVDFKVIEEKQIANNQEKVNDMINENTINQISQEESKTTDFSADYKDFTVEDIEGKTIALSDFQGEPVMILFWSEENTDSVEMLNRMNKQYENYKEKINFMAIQTSTDKTEKSNINVPIYYDQTQEVMEIYDIVELPTILYINKENEVFNSKTGLTSEDALAANLDILSENF